MIKMSMSEYQWQDTDHDRLLECIKWCQNQFQLRDWEIKLDTGVNMPKELKPGDDDDYEALANISEDSFRALLWIPLAKLEQGNHNPIEATIHEMSHILTEARNVSDGDEKLVRIISPLFYRLYCREHKIKIAREK